MEKTSSRLTFSGTALKRLACVSMLLDHIGASCVAALLFTGSFYASANSHPQLFAFYIALRCVGRLAFPIYCFLLVEGFLHTHSVRSYAERMLAFALVSELPFNWAFYGTPFYWQHQNVYWTLFLGVLAMAVMQRFEQPDGRCTLRGAAGMLACAVAAQLLHTDYGALGVVLIAVLYLQRASRKKQCVIGALLTLYEPPAPLAFLPLYRYNGLRGQCGAVQKWLYYWFYPVHLLVLACVTNLVLR